MLRRYGSTQVCEFHLTQEEVNLLVIENAMNRLKPSYDFDYANPVLLRKEGNYIIRFIQKQVNQDADATLCKFGPFEKVT